MKKIDAGWIPDYRVSLCSNAINTKGAMTMTHARRGLTKLQVAIALIFSCLTGLATAQETVTITFMDWWGGVRAEGYAKIIEAFEREYPHIKVEYIRGDNRGEQALTMIAGGTPPDVLAIDQQVVSRLFALGMALPLDDLLLRDGVDRGAFLPGALEGVSFDGVLYGFPKVYNPTHMFANVAYLNESGLALPQLGWTIDEFEQYMQKLTIVESDGTTSRYGMDQPTYSINGWLFIHGGAYVDRETGGSTITDLKFIKAAEWLAEMQQRGYFGSFEGSWSRDFANGRVAFADDGWMTSVPELMSLEPNFEVYTSYLPRGDESTPTFLTIHPHIILRQSKHPNEAWEFLKFMNLSEEANYIRAVYGHAPGTILGTQYVVDLAEIPVSQRRDYVFDTYLNPTNRIVGLPATTPGFAEAANQYIWPAIRRALNGETDVSRALNEIAESVEKTLADTRMQ